MTRKEMDKKYQELLEYLVPELIRSQSKMGWTLAELAERSCLSASTISKLFGGYTKWPQLRTISNLCTAFGVKLTITPTSIKLSRAA